MTARVVPVGPLGMTEVSISVAVNNGKCCENGMSASHCPTLKISPQVHYLASNTHVMKCNVIGELVPRNGPIPAG